MIHPMLNVAIQAARKASRVILRYVDQVEQIEITQKSVNDYVTQVDKQSEEIILTEIKKAYPAHAFYTEETTNDPSALKKDYCWIIDPIDGTRNFMHGLPHFAISIALQVKGELEVGLVYDPVRQELFTATRGKGAYLNSRRIRVSPTKKLEHCLIATGFPFYNKESTSDFLKTFEKVFMRCGDIRRAGSAALDLAYVAAGRIDGLWENGLEAWDIAAGILLIKEAGGIVSDYHGNDTCLKSGEVVVGNQKIQKELLEIIK